MFLSSYFNQICIIYVYISKPSNIDRIQHKQSKVGLNSEFPFY